MKSTLNNLDPSTIRKLMQMDGGEVISEEEIEEYRKHMDFETVQGALNNLDNPNKPHNQNSNNNVTVQTNTNSNNNGMPDLGGMMKIAQDMMAGNKGGTGGMDFSKLMNNPEVMKMMGGMMGGKSNNNEGNGNSGDNPMMKSISNILWFFSGVQQTFSFVFSIKGLALFAFIYWYFYHYKKQLLPVNNNFHNNDDRIDHQHNEYLDDEA
jgi:hypothetical protein